MKSVTFQIQNLKNKGNMTKGDYLDHTGDLMADRKGKDDIESICYFIPEVTGLDAGWDDEDKVDFEHWDEHWEDRKDFEDHRGYCDAYTCIMFNN